MLFITMRLVSGGDLRDVMQREGQGGLAPGRALELLAPVAAALDAAHATGLVHRVRLTSFRTAAASRTTSRPSTRTVPPYS